MSHEAARILARIIPGDILANRYCRMYERSCAAKEDVGLLTDRARVALRREERARVIAEWKSGLEDCEDDQPGSRVREILVSKLEDWMARRHGGLTFHTTQILTGHDCFNHYLYKIGRLVSLALIAGGGGVVDTAQHTLEGCPAWTVERESLTEAVGRDLSLSSILEVALLNKDKWRAFAVFCEDVMAKKEQTERERQRAPVLSMTGQTLTRGSAAV